MNLLRYKAKHFPILERWLKERQSYIPAPAEMPSIGYIGFDKGEPIAAAFLRRVEGGYAQLDGLVSNPTASPEQRHNGIDLVVSAVMGKAKHIGIKQLFALTIDSSVLTRSDKHGFKTLPEQLIAVDLSTSRQCR